MTVTVMLLIRVVVNSRGKDIWKKRDTKREQKLCAWSIRLISTHHVWMSVSATWGMSTSIHRLVSPKLRGQRFKTRRTSMSLSRFWTRRSFYFIVIPRIWRHYFREVENVIMDHCCKLSGSTNGAELSKLLGRKQCGGNVHVAKEPLVKIESFPVFSARRVSSRLNLSLWKYAMSGDKKCRMLRAS